MTDPLPVAADLLPMFGVPRSPHWEAVRKAHLEREPECQACGGKDALNVHHVQPYHLHPEMELEDSNLITLCEQPGHCCHFVNGHFLEWSSWNSNVRKDAAAYLEKVRSRPHDPKRAAIAPFLAIEESKTTRFVSHYWR